METDSAVAGDPTNLADRSLEELSVMLATPSGSPAPEPAAEAPVKEPEATDVAATPPIAETPAAAETPVETPPVEAPAVPEATEEEKLAKMRLRPRDPQDQQVMDLYKSEGFEGSFLEASNIIYGRTDTTPTPAPAAEAAPPVEPGQEQLAKANQLQTEMADLQTRIQEAAGNLEHAEALKLQQEFTTKQLEAYQLTEQAKRAQESHEQELQSTQRSKAMESRDAALVKYPFLAEKESVARKQFDAYVADKLADPDYAAIFESPKWPEIVAHEFAASTNRVPAAVEAANTAQSLSNPAPAASTTKAKMLTSGETVAPPITVTPELIAGSLPKLSTDNLRDLLSIDPRKRAR